MVLHSSYSLGVTFSLTQSGIVLRGAYSGFSSNDCIGSFTTQSSFCSHAISDIKIHNDIKCLNRFISDIYLKLNGCYVLF